MDKSPSLPPVAPLHFAASLGSPFLLSATGSLQGEELPLFFKSITHAPFLGKSTHNVVYLVRPGFDDGFFSPSYPLFILELKLFLVNSLTLVFFWDCTRANTFPYLRLVVSRYSFLLPLLLGPY